MLDLRWHFTSRMDFTSAFNFSYLYHLIKGMRPKICGNWVLLIYLDIEQKFRRSKKFDISPKVISTWGRIDPMSFRTLGFSVLCHFFFAIVEMSLERNVLNFINQCSIYKVIGTKYRNVLNFINQCSIYKVIRTKYRNVLNFINQCSLRSTVNRTTISTMGIELRAARRAIILIETSRVTFLFS